MAKPGTTIADGADAIMTHHVVSRIGDQTWGCRFCEASWHAMPMGYLGPCRPRRYGDGAPELTDGAPVDDPMTRPCCKCDVSAGEHCRDLRRVMGTLTRPHKER